MKDMRRRFIDWYYGSFRESPLWIVMDSVTEGSPYHRESSVGVHTDMVIAEYLAAQEAAWGEWDNNTFLGALTCVFHDVGKPATMEIKNSESRGEYKAFPGHEIRSARLWESWAVQNLSQLWSVSPEFSLNDIYTVTWMVEHHRPWGLKQRDKVLNLATTAVTTVGANVFIRAIRSDAYGRIMDNPDYPKTENWLEDFSLMCHMTPSSYEMTANELVGKPRISMPIGASGTGKSTLRSNHEHDHEVFSLDTLRKEWYDPDARVAFLLACADKGFANKSFQVFIEMIKEGKNVFVDNTNLSAKVRRKYLVEAARHGYLRDAYVMPVTLQEVQDRQANREDEAVPLSIVEDQYNRLQQPMFHEFDRITVLDTNIS